MPRLGPRAAYNHRREPLSVSQPTHTFKFPDPAPCFWPPFLLASLSKKFPAIHAKYPPSQNLRCSARTGARYATYATLSH